MKSTQYAIVSDTASPRPRPIGSFLRDAGKLSDEQIARILASGENRGMRFGEIAVALRLVDERDVLAALSEQFAYAAVDDRPDAELTVAADPFGAQAEAFRELRSRLLLEALPESAPFTLAVVSALTGEGKTYLAANLAAAFSQLGSRTLLIDADLRGGRLDRLLGLQGGAGLSNVLAGFAGHDEALHRVGGLGNLWVMPAGPLPPNPVELLQGPAFDALVCAMKDKFERVVLDTAAASRGADCRIVAARATASILVARRNETRLDALATLVDALNRGPAKLAGVVMNER